MNDFSELEAELKRLQPAAVSPDLTARVERALASATTSTPTAGLVPRRREFRLNWFALGLGAAAAAAFLMLARVSVNHPTAQKNLTVASTTAAPETIATAQPTLVPDGVTRVVYNTSNEGLVFPGGADQPVRRVRSRSRETLHWKDAGTGASLRVSYPTEEVRFIPVSGQ
jgi:hypothetical protein